MDRTMLARQQDRHIPFAERAASLQNSGTRPYNAPSPRIGLIRNPRSHRNKRADTDRAVLSRVPPSVTLSMPADHDALIAALEGFVADGIDVLAIDGGDGTVRDVLTAGAAVFGDRWPDLLLVPKGKTNALAIDLRLPNKWQLADGLEALRTGRTVVRRPLVVERADGSQDPRLGFIFGAGAFNAAIDTGQTAHRFGAFQGFAVACTAAMGMAQALFGIGDSPWRHAAKMRITDAGTDRPVHRSELGTPDTRYLAMFSSLDVFPAGIAPFRLSGRGIRYLLIDAPLRRVTARLPAILWGSDRPNHPAIGVHRGAGEAFVLDLAEGFILDGEAFAPGRLRLLQGPELRFIVP